jgi:hypothetical protein
MKRRMKRHAVIQPPDQSIRLIPLTQGQNAIVDVSDYEWLNQWNWFALWTPCTKSFYAARNGHKSDTKDFIYMAPEILVCSSGELADHRNHNTLDNRRQNLRKATYSQSLHNRRMRSDNATGFKGIRFHKYDNRRKKYSASITTDGKTIGLGYFNTPKEAHEAYVNASIEFHGEFAYVQSIKKEST